VADNHIGVISGPDDGARTVGETRRNVETGVHAKEVTLEATQTPPLSDFLDTCASQSVRGDGSANLCRQRPRSTQSLLSIAGSNHWPGAALVDSDGSALVDSDGSALVDSDGTSLDAVKPDGMGGEGVGVGSGAICRQQTFEISRCSNGVSCVSCRRPSTALSEDGPCPTPSLVLAREDEPDDSEPDHSLVDSSSESEFGQNGYVDETSSEDDECVAVSSAAKAAPVASFTGDEGGCVEPRFASLQPGDDSTTSKASVRTRRKRRKRSSILRSRLQREPLNSIEPKHHCAEALQRDEEDDTPILPRMARAKRAYEAFHRLPPGCASDDQVRRSSAGVEGWISFASTLEGVDASQRQIRNLKVVQSGILKGMVCPSAEEARLIEKLSEGNAGFSAIDSIVDHLGHPSGGSLCLCEGEKRAEVMANVSDGEWIDVEFEVALDSGSTDHVCHPSDLPGYVVEASPGSRAGQGFIVGNGARVTNDGQSVLSLQGGDKEHTMSTTFQVAKVSRPLMSVGRLCDKGFDVLFKKDRADVLSPDNTVILSFERQDGGLYVAKLRLKRPASPFGRPGR